MQIKLNDGTILTPIMVSGAHKFVQGANRDSLTFVFADNESIETLDALFSEANCEKITLIGVDSQTVQVEVTQEDGTKTTEYETVATDAIYTNYTIRAELKKQAVEISQSTASNGAVYENRIFVTMAERTYSENKLAQVASESVDTQLAVAELAELMVGGAV